MRTAGAAEVDAGIAPSRASDTACNAASDALPAASTIAAVVGRGAGHAANARPRGPPAGVAAAAERANAVTPFAANTAAEPNTAAPRSPSRTTARVEGRIATPEGSPITLANARSSAAGVTGDAAAPVETRAIDVPDGERGRPSAARTWSSRARDKRSPIDAKYALHEYDNASAGVSGRRTRG